MCRYRSRTGTLSVLSVGRYSFAVPAWWVCPISPFYQCHAYTYCDGFVRERVHHIPSSFNKLKNAIGSKSKSCCYWTCLVSYSVPFGKFALQSTQHRVLNSAEDSSGQFLSRRHIHCGLQQRRGGSTAAQSSGTAADACAHVSMCDESLL